MPEEVLALLIVISIMTFVFTVIRSSQQYRLKKLEHERGREQSEESLTTSELRAMIQEAVVDATEPMQEELGSLAARLDAIDGGSDKLLLEEEVERLEKTVGRQTRQRGR